MSSAESSNFSNSSATPSRANASRIAWNHRIIVIVVPHSRALGGEGVLHICTTTITIFPNILSSIEKTDPFCLVRSRPFFVAPRSPRLAHVGLVASTWPVLRRRAPTPPWPRVWPTARLPKWHGQRPAGDRPMVPSPRFSTEDASGNQRNP